jgi:hypothetical protein
LDILSIVHVRSDAAIPAAYGLRSLSRFLSVMLDAKFQKAFLAFVYSGLESSTGVLASATFVGRDADVELTRTYLQRVAEARRQ